jgi:phosphohistidine phosphatase
MEVYVVRHGEAAPAEAASGEEGRRLTPRGEAESRAAAHGLRGLGVRLERVFTSPLRRAVQTAEVLALVIPAPGPETRPVLDGGSSAEAILAAIEGEGASIALVGHQPVLGELVALAVAGIASGGVALGTASVARLEFEGGPRVGAGRLRWLLTADQLGRIAGR